MGEDTDTWNRATKHEIVVGGSDHQLAGVSAEIETIPNP